MVLVSESRSLQNIAENIRGRELQFIGTATVGGVSGLFLAQELADVTLPILQMSPDPSSQAELGASAIVKLVGAFVFVTLAARAGGDMVMALAGSVAFGMLVSMGLDLFDMVQRGSVPGLATQSGPSVAAPSPPAPSPSGGSVTRVSPSPTPSSGGRVTGGYR